MDYSIKDVEAPAPELTSEQPSSRRLEAQVDGSLQFRPGNGSGSLSVAQPRSALTQGKLKSILKKPGEEAGKENQRVKFMLAGNGGSSSSQVDSPPATSSAGGGAVGFADVAPPQPQPQPRQTLPQPSLPPPARSYEPNHFAPPPRPVENRAPPAVQFSEAQNYGGGIGETEGNSRSNVDISHQMLSLLLRCNDIVTGLRALPDFVPYRPL